MNAITLIHRKAFQLLILFMISTLNIGCGLIFGTSQKVDHKNSEYRISRLDRHRSDLWKLIPAGKKPERENFENASASEQEPEAADYAFENTKSGAIVSLNSVCNPQRSATLQELTDNLLMGLPQPEVVYVKDVEIDGVHALDQLISTESDSRTTVNIRTVVLRKSACTYDFMYISKASAFDAYNPDFEYFLKGFHAP